MRYVIFRVASFIRYSHESVLGLDVVLGVIDKHVFDEIRIRYQHPCNSVEEIVARNLAVQFDEPEGKQNNVDFINLLTKDKERRDIAK